MMDHSTLTEMRRLLSLAAPLVLAQLAQMSMGFVDTLMVGRLGNEALAGIALGSTLYFFVFIVFVGVLFAVVPLVSQAHGAGDAAAVGRATRQGLWLGAGLSLPAVILFWNAAPLLSALGQEPQTVALASSYLWAIAWGFLPGLCLGALRGMLEGLSKPTPIMIISLFAVGVNVLANSALMFGRWGFPELGLVGTGYASAFVYWLMFGAAALYVRLTLSHYRIFAGLRTPDGATLRELFALGWPIGLTLGFETGLFSVTALLMGLLGSEQLAAHQIALQTASITFMVPVGLATAVSVRVGQAVGRGDVSGARLAGSLGIGLSGAFMVGTALLFWAFPHTIVGLYIDLNNPANAAVVRLAVTYLGMAAMFQVFDGVQVSASGALRGLKDTRVPMLLSLVSYWLVGLGTGVWLTFGLGWGGRGLWLGLVAGLGAAAALLLGRFYRSVGRDERVAARARGSA